MGIAKLKQWAASGMSVALFGTAGLGLMSAPAGQEKGKPKDPPAAEAKVDPPAKPEEPKAAEPPAEEAPRRLRAKDESEVRRALAKPCSIENITAVPSFDALTTQLQQEAGILILIDYAAFIRVFPDSHDIRLGEAKVPSISGTYGMTILEVLDQAVAFLPIPGAVQVRGNKVVIVPAYRPMPPAQGGQRTSEQIVEQTYGPPVHLGVRNKPLSEVLDSLREQTGANIVLGSPDAANQQVSISLDDVRLRTALTVLADMAGLRVVVFGNVYYVTTPESATRMQAEADRDLFGEKK